MKDILAMAGLSKQAHWAYMRRQKVLGEKQALLLRSVEGLRKIHPQMGGKKLYILLKPDFIGRDRFLNLLRDAGLNLETHHNPKRTTFSVKCWRYSNLCVGLKVTDVNQLWVSDISYYIMDEQCYYLTFIMDVYSRMILGFVVADNMRATANLLALSRAVKCRNSQQFHGRLIHHSDRGSQYASDAYTQRLEQHGIRISMCATVYENTHMERVNGTIKNEYLRHWKPKDGKSLERCVSKAVKAYNRQRPHQSLGYKSPEEFEAQIAQIPMQQRIPMTIFTDQKSQRKAKLRNQMELF